jgi:hypothetical protein
LSRKTGISRKTLRDMRRQEAAELEQLQEHASVAPDEKKTAVLAVVLRCYPINPRVVDARLKESGDLVRVRVRDNRLFVPGQEMPVIPEKDGASIYVLACRHPVIRGRLRWEEGLVK